jgi:orotate phosphoribosyltransferase
LVVALALHVNLPFVMVRRAKKTHGTALTVEGAVEEGEEVLVIEDVATTGNSILLAARAVRDLGAVVRRAVAVVDRGEGAEELLAAHNIELTALMTLGPNP